MTTNPSDPSSDAQAATAPAATEPPPVKRKSSKPWWLLLVLGVILLVGYLTEMRAREIFIAALGVAVTFVGSTLQHKDDERRHREHQEELRNIKEAIREARTPPALRPPEAQGMTEQQWQESLEKKYGLPAGKIAEELPVFLQKIKGNHTASLWERAKAAKELGYFDEAEKLFLGNAAELEQEQKQRLAIIAESYENAGRSSQSLRHHDVAIVHLQKAAQYIDQNQAPVRLAEILYTLAQCLDSTGRCGEAEAILRHVITLQEENLGTTHPSVLCSRNVLANAMAGQGKLGEAEIESRSTLKSCEDILGEYTSCYSLLSS